jgi:GT2 family glycosyltransferase
MPLEPVPNETHATSLEGGLASEPLVTIVVVPRERFSYAQSSLESLYANTHSSFRLVYVDGGSPSSVRRYLKKQSQLKGFQLVRTKHYLSPNQARNIGLGHVKTKYVTFVDNDVEVAPGWLEKLVQCAEESDASVVGPLYCIGKPVHEVVHAAGGEGSIRVEDGRRRLHEKMCLCNQRVSDVRPQMRRQACELVEFHVMLVRRDVFEKVGPLDEGLLNTREHLDFCFTVRNAGGTVWFEPDAVITYAPDSVWPTEPPSFGWSDIPFYLMRWSDTWGQKSLAHFEQKWNLDASSAQLRTSWLRPHRRIPLRKLRARLRRFVGGKLGDRLVDSLEQIMFREAS